MKSPTFAPAYAVFFPMLAEVAQDCGYALAIHGSLQSDFDLLASPWTDDAVSDNELMQAIADYVGIAMSTIYGSTKVIGPESKPHGRKAWAIIMGNGAYIDLSVMPRLSKKQPSDK